jgi:DnaK suppressor protein
LWNFWREAYRGVSDEVDMASMLYDDSIAATNTSRYNTQIKAITTALEKIDDGTYGICEECGEEIPIERLKILPFAARCVDCQEQKET